MRRKKCSIPKFEMVLGEVPACSRVSSKDEKVGGSVDVRPPACLCRRTERCINRVSSVSFVVFVIVDATLVFGHIAQAAWFRISNMEVTWHISKAIATSNQSLKVFCLSTFHIEFIPNNLTAFIHRSLQRYSTKNHSSNFTMSPSLLLFSTFTHLNLWHYAI
jgi:hypothetical protein